MIIKDLRLKNALSQEQLASLTNLSTRTIQRIEKDDSASISSLNALAKVFDLEINELQIMLKDKKSEQTPPKQKRKNQKLIPFFLVNLLLFTINMLTNPHHWWFLYTFFGWGIPLLFMRLIKQKRKTPDMP